MHVLLTSGLWVQTLWYCRKFICQLLEAKQIRFHHEEVACHAFILKNYDRNYAR